MNVASSLKTHLIYELHYSPAIKSN